ncbi:MAG TPA: glucose-1-phosphate adenylyltransferase [Pyrinomonadaceae bacterium]|nr:glucose-1-phosphate adenylyltransferase [Pyrinomonadaceae bacterium]
MRNVLCILLAGGVGQRLYPLTRDRCKPAVPFGGIYRIIDITLSNCINSGLRRVYILAQYKQQSLSRHINQGWHMMQRDLDEFIEIAAAQQRNGNDWYRGTADAVYQNLYTFDQEGFDDALIVSGDHIYKMNYAEMLEYHREKDADVTVAVIEVPKQKAAGVFGVLEVDAEGRVLGFEEKPADPKPLPHDPNSALASMGIYIFKRDVLYRALNEDSAETNSKHDFGHDILPRLIHEERVYSFNFRDVNKGTAKYWRDIGTLDAYYEANMDLVSVIPVFSLYDRNWPLRTNALQLPPAKFVTSGDGQRMGIAVDSIVAPGCIISGGRARRSVLSYGVRMHSYSEVEDSIIFPNVTIGKHTCIRGAIIDSGVEIPDGTVIGYDIDIDREYYTVTEAGRIVVPSGTVFVPQAGKPIPVLAETRTNL